MSRTPVRHVTLKDIARELGVSAMTVSRALSDKHALVSVETVRRVRDVAKRVGYTPNLLARSLRGEQLPTLVVFAEFISVHHYLAALLDLATREIEARGYSVITCQSHQSMLHVVRQFNLAGGVILAPPQSVFFDEQGRPKNRIVCDEPLVVIHTAMEQLFFNEVSPDLEDAAFQVAEHLIGLGHKRLGFLGGPSLDHESRWFNMRRSGIVRAMQAGGLSADTLVFQPCNGSAEADAAVRQLLSETTITGLICLNDELAVAAIHTARNLGRVVPRDLSVVGSNDLELARHFSPSPTTLAINVRELVDAGLKLLFKDIERDDAEPSPSPIRQRLKCRLIVRESTGPAPA